MQPLIFLKLGGSLITDKNRPHHLEAAILGRLAGEVAEALRKNHDLRLVVGHGSGSFGHTAAKKYDTRQGVRTPQQWLGFAEVWYEASRLNRFVIEALTRAGVPVVNFPPSTGVTAEGGKIVHWDTSALKSALNAGLVPVVQGDVAFDLKIGGTIVSTEEVFDHLARQLKPNRILLAGIEDGVWEDYPARTRLYSQITPRAWEKIGAALQGSSGTDVTGGMRQKVLDMLALIHDIPALEVLIFTGKTPGLVSQALLGGAPGTLIRA